jgi:hypothetical protein
MLVSNTCSGLHCSTACRSRAHEHIKIYGTFWGVLVHINGPQVILIVIQKGSDVAKPFQLPTEARQAKTQFNVANDMQYRPRRF